MSPFTPIQRFNGLVNRQEQARFSMLNGCALNFLNLDPAVGSRHNNQRRLNNYGRRNDIATALLRSALKCEHGRALARGPVRGELVIVLVQFAQGVEREHRESIARAPACDKIRSVFANLASAEERAYSSG